MATTIFELTEILNRLGADGVEQLANDAIDSTLAGLMEADSNINLRIYNKNQDINGQSFGGYSEAYKEYRESLGLNGARKNLQFTDNMKNTTYINYEEKSMRLSEKSDKSVGARNKKFKLTDVTQAEKARYNEQYLGMRIFEASEQERQESVQTVYDTFTESVLNYFK